jgi:hypothetical protein
MEIRLQRFVKLTPAVLALTGSSLFTAATLSPAAAQTLSNATSTTTNSTTAKPIVVNLYGDGSQQSVELDRTLEPNASHALLSSGRVRTIVLGIKGLSSSPQFEARPNPENPKAQQLIVRDANLDLIPVLMKDLDGNGSVDLLFVGNQVDLGGATTSSAATTVEGAAQNSTTQKADTAPKGLTFNPSVARFNLAPQPVKQFATPVFARSQKWGVQQPNGFAFNTMVGSRRFRY